mgnify:CR=1 FL=1
MGSDTYLTQSANLPSQARLAARQMTQATLGRPPFDFSGGMDADALHGLALPLLFGALVRDGTYVGWGVDSAAADGLADDDVRAEPVHRDGGDVLRFQKRVQGVQRGLVREQNREPVGEARARLRRCGRKACAGGFAHRGRPRKRPVFG